MKVVDGSLEAYRGIQIFPSLYYVIYIRLYSSLSFTLLRPGLRIKAEKWVEGKKYAAGGSPLPWVLSPSPKLLRVLHMQWRGRESRHVCSYTCSLVSRITMNISFDPQTKMHYWYVYQCLELGSLGRSTVCQKTTGRAINRVASRKTRFF
jgi:hypothetical protein